jgi:hypothetical protein
VFETPTTRKRVNWRTPGIILDVPVGHCPPLTKCANCVETRGLSDE